MGEENDRHGVEVVDDRRQMGGRDLYVAEVVDDRRRTEDDLHAVEVDGRSARHRDEVLEEEQVGRVSEDERVCLVSVEVEVHVEEVVNGGRNQCPSTANQAHHGCL